MVGRTGVGGIGGVGGVVVCPGAAAVVCATALGDEDVGGGVGGGVDSADAELTTGAGADELANALLGTAELAIGAALRW